MSNKPFEVFTQDRYRLEIHVDNNAESPRKFDCNLGIMACFHKRYNIGDSDHGIDSSKFCGWAEMEEYIWKTLRAYAVLPVYMYDHSGQTISTYPFSCPWDSGQLGFIFTTQARIRELGVKLPRAKDSRTERLEEMLRSEIKVYDQYMTNDVYGFELYKDGKFKDSCWGFYGSDHKASGLFDHAGWPLQVTHVASGLFEHDYMIPEVGI